MCTLGDARRDVPFALRAGPRSAAVRVWADENAGIARSAIAATVIGMVGDAYAKGAAAARVGAVYAVWVVALGLAGHDSRALGGTVVAVGEV